MGKGRIIYQNWIVEFGADPSQKYNPNTISEPLEPNEEIIHAVRSALKILPHDQQEFIQLYYYEGASYIKISETMNLEMSIIEGLHRQSVKSLKRILADFVKENFGIDTKNVSDCPICQSPDKENINKLLTKKSDEETWKKTMAELKNKFGIKISTPQVLIGHRKYHINREKKND